MRIRMTKLAAGPLGVWPVGSVHDVDVDVAVAFVSSGAATYIDPPSAETAVEEAVVQAPEHAVGRGQRRRRG
jgi:FixJ family two-component response regulator